MDIQFEIGDPSRPRGHALLYFRVDTEPDHVYGTYIVTLPITADLTKYVPPFLAAHLGSGDTGPLANFAAFAMPPMSELVEGGYDRLVQLANLRSDDLVYGGSMFSYDLPRMMEVRRRRRAGILRRLERSRRLHRRRCHVPSPPMTPPSPWALQASPPARPIPTIATPAVSASTRCCGAS